MDTNRPETPLSRADDKPGRPGTTATANVDRAASQGFGLWALILRVYLPFALGFFMSYLFRSVNAVLAPNLVADIGLSPANLGLLTSSYFLGFALMQLPIGVALDRFGPPRVQAGFLFLAALGSGLFGSSGSLFGLIVGRALIGAGAAVALMASFKAIVLWFPRERWALVNGCVMGVGGLGALAATAPIEFALGLTTWRGVFYLLAAVTACVAVATVIVVPEKRRSTPPGSLGEQWRGLGLVFRDRFFWRLAPVAAFTNAAGMAIQGLWAGPWLRDVSGQDRMGVAAHLLLLAAFLTIGKLGVGVVADFLNNRFGISLLRVLIVGTLLFFGVQGLLVARVDPASHWIWILFGLLSTVTTLAFAIFSQHFPTAYSARSNTAFNLLMFGFSFIAQYAIGAIIGLWPESTGGHYPPVAYSVAFGTILAVQVLAFVWLLLPSPARHPPREEVAAAIR